MVGGVGERGRLRTFACYCLLVVLVQLLLHGCIDTHAYYRHIFTHTNTYDF